jgi:GntR family transcriptional regulator
MKIQKPSMSLSHLAKEQLLEYIEKNQYEYQDRLPSEAQIQEMLGVSRSTVREALALLEQEGIVYKIQGKGTFLATLPIKIKNGLEELRSTTDTIRKFGYVPGTKGYKVRKITADTDMQQKLNLSPDDKVLTFERIRTANELVAAYCIDTFPEKIFKGKLPQQDYQGSMFEYLERDLDIHIEYAVAEILPASFEGKMCEKLGIPQDTFFILLKQIHFDRQGQPMIYSMDYYNSNIFRFFVNRKRNLR